MKSKRTWTFSNLLLALVGFLFLASLSVVLVLNLRSIYYFDIDYLNLAEESGYSEEIIRDNYDALIDYNLIWKGVDELEFPDFPMSDEAAVHFREVKRIFVLLQILCPVTGVIFLIFLCRKMIARDYGSLKLISILTFAIPIILGAYAALNWETFFVQFHELFFQNDYWLFNPITDPVILILPDTFFAHCAAAILLILFAGGILTGVLHRLLTRKLRKSGRPSRTNSDEETEISYL
ncbi:MAG: TIGR01906 family membrane protein [Lachnospiraceae bacterium]|nr:TIGR01906 family membrane protein [Lachnospiraceae bacterium]